MLTLVNCQEKDLAKTHTEEPPGGVNVCACVRERAEAGPSDAAAATECVLTDLSFQSTGKAANECSCKLLVLYRVTEEMQSQGSTSSQPSFDSLSSSDSLFYSDLEPAEDDADVFLTDSSPSVIISGAGRPAADRDGGSESPGSQWACDGFTDKEEEEESDRSDGSGKGTDVGVRGTDPASQSQKSQGDLLFAQKCAELQGFVRPLLELLNGLKRGRFDRGLSSFQQSVAMDRIQRIVGVLQRPNIGEKYLNILLQVEMMLKVWFPQITANSVSAASSAATASPTPSLQHTSSSTPAHKHRDQSHIPVKKRRLSWTGTDSTTPSPVLKCPRINRDEEKKEEEEDKRKSPPSVASDAPRHLSSGVSQLNEDTKGKDSDGEEKDKPSKYKAGQTSEPSLTWVHVAPILSPRKACRSHEGIVATGNNENQHVTAACPPRNGRCPATQDCSISSTTTPCKHPKNPKKPTQCQSKPVAEQQSDSDTCQGQSKSSQVTLTTLPRGCATPAET